MHPVTINIELGLSALCDHAEPGQTLTQEAIAYVCGCTHSSIVRIEKIAVKKLIAKLNPPDSNG